MKILKLFQKLLQHYTTPSEASHSSFLNNSYTSISPQSDPFISWGNVTTGIASKDGYLNIFARSINDTTSEMRIIINNDISDGGLCFTSSQTNTNMDMACSAPIAKGQKYVIKATQIKQIIMRFYDIIGGGEKLGFWRVYYAL